MRTFLSIIVVLVLATAAVMYFGRAQTAPPTVTPQQKSPSTPAVTPAVKEAEAAPATPAPAVTSTITPPVPVEEAKQTNAAAPTPSAAAKPETISQQINKLDAALKDLEKQQAAAPPSSDSATPTPAPGTTHNARHNTATPGPAAPPAPPEAAAPPSDKPAEPAAPPGESKDAYTVGAPARLAPEADGWTRIDDRFLLKGAGTPEDPYILPWDILVSASESYRPRLGKKEIPARVEMLNGKHVRITGYVLFPMMGNTANELLLMRNQWDGCCIGVPPTPYDAIEVKLTKPAERKDMFVTYMTLEGVLGVEPYVNKDWLLGFYTLSKGELTQPANDKDKGL